MADEFCDTALRTIDDDNVTRLVPEGSWTHPVRPTVEVVQAKEKAVLLRHLRPKRKRKEGYSTLEEEQDDEPGIWKV
jgi:hypothetical protein